MIVSLVFVAFLVLLIVICASKGKPGSVATPKSKTDVSSGKSSKRPVNETAIVKQLAQSNDPAAIQFIRRLRLADRVAESKFDESLVPFKVMQSSTKKLYAYMTDQECSERLKKLRGNPSEIKQLLEEKFLTEQMFDYYANMPLRQKAELPSLLTPDEKKIVQEMEFIIYLNLHPYTHVSTYPLGESAFTRAETEHGKWFADTPQSNFLPQSRLTKTTPTGMRGKTTVTVPPPPLPSSSPKSKDKTDTPYISMFGSEVTKSGSQARNMDPKSKTRTLVVQHSPDVLRKGHEGAAFQSGRDPAAKTTWGAKSDVFAKSRTN